VYVVWELFANLLNFLANLGTQPVHILPPVEANTHKRLVVAGSGHQALDVRNGADRFFQWFGNGLLNLSGSGIWIRYPDADEGKVDVRRQNQWDLGERHEAKNNERDKGHADRHRVANGKL